MILYLMPRKQIMFLNLSLQDCKMKITHNPTSMFHLSLQNSMTDALDKSLQPNQAYIKAHDNSSWQKHRAKAHDESLWLKLLAQAHDKALSKCVWL